MRTKAPIGQVFGRLTVVGDAPDYVGFGGERRRMVGCRCECGKELPVRLGALKNGNTKSCGCLNVDVARQKSLRHGASRIGKKTPTFRCWQSIKERCLNEKSKDYPNYGGRGISICDRWINSFNNFFEDMGERPLGMSIDRKENHLGYFKENCRWATRLEQNNNTRKNRWIEFGGERKTLAAWERHRGWPQGMIANRLFRGWSESDAVSVKPRKILPSVDKVA